MSEYIYERPDGPAKVVRDGWNVRVEWDFEQREEIVRCRYCRYASAGEAVISGNWQHGNCGNPRFRGSLHAANVRADYYCAWGERSAK
jgi:hypothetical protein